MGYFFLLHHVAIFKPTNFPGPVSYPAKFGSRYGTEDTPLVSSGTEVGFILFDSYEEWHFPF
jgi:hypothetical protein